MDGLLFTLVNCKTTYQRNLHIHYSPDSFLLSFHMNPLKCNTQRNPKPKSKN